MEYPETAEPVLIRSHAVVRDDDGTLNDRTECAISVYVGPNTPELRTWDLTDPLKRCQVCVNTAGGWLVNGVTGERRMPPG